MTISVRNLANVFDAINHGTYDRNTLQKIAEGKHEYNTLFSTLHRISEYYPDLEPLQQDSYETLLEKYSYWVNEHNDGYDPYHFTEKE